MNIHELKISINHYIGQHEQGEDSKEIVEFYLSKVNEMYHNIVTKIKTKGNVPEENWPEAIATVHEVCFDGLKEWNPTC